ncbi:MAG: choice-of-anchor D domain-containing protein, partial [Kofleriaceae bacterium]
MSKRWVGSFLFLAGLCWSSAARAAITPGSTTVAAGNVFVGETGTVTTTLVSDATDEVTLYDMVGAGCSRFSIEPPVSDMAPLEVTGTAVDLTISFTPNARGAASCVVTLRNGATDLGSFTLTGTGVGPQLALPAGPVSFGSVRWTGAAKATRTITIQNTGDAGQPLRISAIQLATHTEFTIPNPPTLPVDLAPNATLDVVVELDPAMAGTRTDTLEVTSDDPVMATRTVALTGEGTNAVIAVTDVPFGVVSVGVTQPGNIKVSNNAVAPVGTLRVTSAAITGGSGWFTFAANGNGCTGPACTFAGTGLAVTTAPVDVGVRCTPPAGASGMQTATVAFTSDSDAGGQSTATLTCTAGRATIEVDPTSLAFGDVAVGSSSPLTLVVKNVGTQTLNYSRTGTVPAGYSFTGCTSACTLAPGTMANLVVTFAPTSPGQADFTLTLTSNDPQSPLSVPVTGRGVAPQINAPAPLAFGDIEVGKTSTPQALTATNMGTAPLTITNAAFATGGTDYAATTGTVGAQMTVIPPGGSVTWNITCSPTVQGARPGTFRITSNSFTGATTNVGLTCNGQQGVLAVTPTSLDFGAVPQGTVVTRTFTLRNTGNVLVTGITSMVDPMNVGYSLDPATPVPAMLAAGAQVTLTARFAPQSGSDGGPATIRFTGNWGVTPTTTMATLNLTGDGLTAGYDVNPNAIAYGDLRFDTSKTATFCISNTDQSAVQILNPITITPGTGTMTGEFAVGQIRKVGSCGATTGTTAPLPQTLAPGEVLEVTVRVQPNNRTGAMSATATVNSNLAMNPTRTVNLTANSTSAMLAVSPGATIDFGAVDVQGPAATRTVTITNTGQAVLDLSNFNRTANPQFTFTVPSNTSLVPGAMLPIEITYKPIVASPAGSEETVTLQHGIAGVHGGPASGMILLRGRGIDRELALGPTPVFPDTFRNPGAAAPVRPVQITNAGEAVLRVSAAMISNDTEVWQLVNPEPVDIPGGGTHEFQIRFSPTRSGRAPDANLQITNDDDARTMVDVMLTGNGLDRDVMFGPDTIRLGYTGIGVPVTVTDALVVASRDATHEFKIARIELDAGSPFTIEETPVDLALPPQATRSFSITFSPETQGEFSTRARLFLDGDSEPQHEVVIEGQAVFVDAHGGGGCSTTSGGAGRGALARAVRGVVLGRRRRRRAALATTATAAAFALAPAARADNVVLSVFDPTPATTTNGFQLQAPDVGENGDWVLSAVMSYATDPLVLSALSQGSFINDAGVITRSTRLDLGMAYAFLGRFEAGVRMPLYQQEGEPLGDPQMEFTTAPADGTARGDLTLHAKARIGRAALSGDGYASLGAVVQVTVPTATDGAFTGIDKPSVRGLLLGALMPGAFSNRLTLSANIGGVGRATATYANLEQKSAVAWGLGIQLRALDRLWLAGEIYGELAPGSRTDEMGNSLAVSPIEWLGGLRWRPDHRFAVGLAAGRGLTRAVGTPALRGVLSLAFTPGASKIRPIHIEVPKIDGDRDGDGLLDSVDKCPNEPEDIDMFEDDDGCPDVDNDNDGIPDAQDKCPLDPEDKDGFEDSDGCPDKDNDNDGIPDDQDKCPNEPEDKDGYLDVDGCPDDDNDRDGIPDAKDKCPNEPETINGNQDEDGCPDRGDPLVIMSPDRLDTLDAIVFKGTTIAKQSLNVLGQVAATL